MIMVLKRTYKGTCLYYAEIPEALRVSVAIEDRSEILGPLLEKAVCFVRR